MSVHQDFYVCKQTTAGSGGSSWIWLEPRVEDGGYSLCITMLLIKRALGMRVLDRDLRALRDSLLYGHADTGVRLPRLHVDIISQNMLPFFALTQPKHQLVAAGAYHTCAVQCDGRLVCFSYNCEGQCSVPAELGPVMAVAGGLPHTCAVQLSGSSSGSTRRWIRSHAPRLSYRLLA